jgi:hypothetical protein
MTWKRSVLVIANVTASTPELLAELKTRAQREPTSFTLVVPATPFGGGRAAAKESLNRAIAQLREAGLEAEGEVGVPDPICAVEDVWDPKRFDEIIVSTLPMRVSKWLHAGLPERVGRLTGAPVTHMVSEPPKPPVPTAPAPAHDDDPGRVLGPLSVLGWGGHHKDE